MPNSGASGTNIRQDPELAFLIEERRKNLHEETKNHSQGRIARELGVSLKTYIELEQGYVRDRRGDSAVLLNDLADVLKMTYGERITLFILSGVPAEQIKGLEPEDIGAYQRILDWIPQPAILHDRRSNIVGVNPPFHALLPELVVGTNFIRWLLTDPAAKTKLINWKEDWAIPTLRVIKTMAAESKIPRAIEFFREMEAATGIHVPVGQHSILGETRGLLDPRGSTVWVTFLSVRPTPEAGSDFLIQIFERRLNDCGTNL